MKTKYYFFLALSLIFLCGDFTSIAQNIPDFLVNEQGSIDGAQQATPAIGSDGNGNYVICWQDKRNGSDFDIYAQIYVNDSLRSTPNFKVNDDAGNALQSTPAVAVDQNQNFIIAWIDKRNGNPNTDWDIYAQRFSGDSTALGDNFIVNDQQESDRKDYPSISIDSSGNFVVVWADKRNGNWDIFGQRFLNDGSTIGVNFIINDDNSNLSQLWPSSSCGKNGNLIVSWVDNRINDDREIYAQRFSADGTPLGNNFKVNTDPTGTNHIRPDIAIDGSGNFIIAWEDNRNGYFDIYAQRYTNNGIPLDENFLITDDTQTSSQSNPSISCDLAGNFTVCWEDNRNDYSDVYARRFSNDGTPLAGDFKVSADNTNNAQQLNTMIAGDEAGNFLICWEDHLFGFNGEIFAQSYLNDGTSVNENFMVNDDFASENQQWPSIAVDGSENFIIAWADDRSDGRGIYVQRFSSDGTSTGNNFKVNDDTGENWASMPSLAANADGSFVIAWSDFRSQACLDIYAQRFSEDGIALGENFRVSYLSACLNYSPKVACKPNGDFIICWGDSDEGGSAKGSGENWEKILSSEKLFGAPDIWAQQFLNDGTPVGENFMVNDNINYSFQQDPDLAVDGAGNFIIAWQDDRNGFTEIFLQPYLSDGTSFGENYKVEDAIYSDWMLDPSIIMDDEGNFTVAWRDNRNDVFDIFCKRFASDGTALGSSFQVNDDTAEVYRYSPCLSLNNNGNFIISWTDEYNGHGNVMAQQFSSSGTPFGNNYRISAAEEMAQSACNVVLQNERIFATWHDNSNHQTGFDIMANVKDWDFWVGIEDHGISNNSCLAILHQNYPNPFSTSTTIKFEMSEPAKITIEIFDHFGQKIETLLNQTVTSGLHEIKFEARGLPGGVYFYGISGVVKGEERVFEVSGRMVVLD